MSFFAYILDFRYTYGSQKHQNSIILAHASALMFAGSCGETSTFSSGAASFGGSAASALAANRVKAKAASNVCNVLMHGNRQFVVRGGAPFGNQVVGISAESG